MKKDYILKNSLGQLKTVKYGNDALLIILSIFGFGWVKLLIDGQSSKAIISILLMYTIVGHLIYCFILGFDEKRSVVDAIEKGYRPMNTEDQIHLQNITGFKIDIIE